VDPIYKEINPITKLVLHPHIPIPLVHIFLNFGKEKKKKKRASFGQPWKATLKPSRKLEDLGKDTKNKLVLG
jgi:hypothetical protein